MFWKTDSANPFALMVFTPKVTQTLSVMTSTSLMEMVATPVVKLKMDSDVSAKLISRLFVPL